MAPESAIHLLGISIVFGNAPAAVTDRTTRALVAPLASEGSRAPPVYPGRDKPLEGNGTDTATPAEVTLRAALADGPLVMAAPGLLTNIATVMRELPELVKHVQQLFAVMGTVRVRMALFTTRR